MAEIIYVAVGPIEIILQNTPGLLYMTNRQMEELARVVIDTVLANPEILRNY